MNLMKSSKDKDKSLTPWVDQPLSGHRLGTAWQGSGSAGKALGVMVGSKLDVRQQWEQGGPAASSVG